MLIDDKARKSQFLKNCFLLADISMNTVLEMFFLTQNNAKINFVNRNLNLQYYTTIKVLLTIMWVELIKNKEFEVINLNWNDEIIIVYVVSLSSSDLNIYPLCKA